MTPSGDAYLFGKKKPKEEAADSAATGIKQAARGRSGGWWADLAESLQKFVDDLGENVKDTIHEAVTLDVKTYVSSDMNRVRVTRDRFTGPVELRAWTRIEADGDMLACVPEGDDESWAKHVDMVRQAQENRAEMIRTAVSAITSIANILPNGD